uniref:Uncharacterized protein n=1 Tax=Arundo donax TaxID=35708 RepID=A0A0A9GFY3_ARUDO
MLSCYEKALLSSHIIYCSHDLPQPRYY